MGKEIIVSLALLTLTLFVTVGAQTQSAVCPSLLTLNETSGVITSPFYPSNYPNYAKCSWEIRASKGKRIKLVIEDMHIEWSSTSCPWDYLQIQNGSLSGDGAPYGRMCGRLTGNVTFFSFREILNVLFVTDGSVTYDGFKATYTQVNFTGITYSCTSGGFFTGSSGFFSSPNFPNNYPQNSRCTWNITVPSGYIIKVSFLHFELEPYQYFPCRYNVPGSRVTITNVASDDGYQPFLLCGQRLPSPVYSVGNSIQVTFASLTNQYSGFNASYMAVTYQSVCPNLTTLNETSGVITSPFYPRKYPNNQTCSWQITASKGKRVVLIIEYMNIQQCGSSCTCDYLEIQNGLSSDGALSRRRCGYLRVTYLSLLESLNVLFLSDGSARQRGFKATYSQVNYTAATTACISGDFVNGSSGFFSSPNFPNHYTQYSICTWNITVPSGYIIKVSFLHFELDGYPYRDRVTITNVASDDGNQPFQLRGQSLPSPVYSLANSITVTLSSLTSNQYSGFNATYTAITYESVCPNLIALNETSGVITSPFYPRNYPDNQACSWQITASKGNRVVLIIEDMYIQKCGSSCTCDYMEIQNGLSSDGVLSGRRCGNIRSTYYSLLESLNVLFVSDGSARQRGFKATYTQVNYTAVTTACSTGDFLTGSTGFFSSPNFPNTYPQYSICTWNITVPNGYIIKVSFLHFELDGYPYRDRVTITNVASDDGNQLFQLSGQSFPSPVYSVANSIKVTLSSLTGNQYSGFNATYTAITFESVCPNLIALNETSGVIISPFYPRNYPDNQACSWQITASKGNRVVLIIEDMYIQQCGSSCTCDYMEIQNGLSSDGTLGERRCAGYLRVTYIYYSILESLKVLFVSNGSGRYRGFKATYTQVNNTAVTTACTSEEFLTGSSGFFSSPNFSNNYPQYSRCAWNITVSSGYIIKINFLHFELDPGQSFPCLNQDLGARVVITNVVSDVGYQTFMLCGQRLPPPVYSVGNSIQVIFTSLANQSSGFNASYSAITYDSVCPNLLTLNETSGVITSPYYPSNYPNNKVCRWQITTSEGKCVKLVVEDINIEFGWSDCPYDYLQIQNFSSAACGALSGTICGSTIDKVTYYSSNESLKVLFVSDGSVRRRGFNATYSQVNCTSFGKCLS